MPEYSDNLKIVKFKLKLLTLNKFGKTSRIRSNFSPNHYKSLRYQRFYSYAMFYLVLKAFVMIFIKLRF